MIDNPYPKLQSDASVELHSTPGWKVFKIHHEEVKDYAGETLVNTCSILGKQFEHEGKRYVTHSLVGCHVRKSYYIVLCFVLNSCQ